MSQAMILRHLITLLLIASCAMPVLAEGKKHIKKKKPAKPVSEYKFSSGESVPTYKFDKRANPIVKAAKKKKTAKKAAGKADKAAAKTDAKLKPSKPIGAEDQPAQDAQGQGGQPAGQ